MSRIILVCSLEGSSAFVESGKEVASDISKACDPTCTRTVGRAG